MFFLCCCFPLTLELSSAATSGSSTGWRKKNTFPASLGKITIRLVTEQLAQRRLKEAPQIRRSARKEK